MPSVYQKLKKVQEDTDRNYFLNAKEALEYGLIDEIFVKKEEDGKK